MYLNFGFTKNLDEKTVIIGNMKDSSNFPRRKLLKSLISANGMNVIIMIKTLKFLYKSTNNNKQIKTISLISLVASIENKKIL